MVRLNRATDPCTLLCNHIYQVYPKTLLYFFVSSHFSFCSHLDNHRGSNPNLKKEKLDQEESAEKNNKKEIIGIEKEIQENEQKSDEKQTMTVRRKRKRKRAPLRRKSLLEATAI